MTMIVMMARKMGERRRYTPIMVGFNAYNVLASGALYISICSLHLHFHTPLSS